MAACNNLSKTVRINADSYSAKPNHGAKPLSRPVEERATLEIEDLNLGEYARQVRPIQSLRVALKSSCSLAVLPRALPSRGPVSNVRGRGVTQGPQALSFHGIHGFASFGKCSNVSFEGELCFLRKFFSATAGIRSKATKRSLCAVVPLTLVSERLQYSTPIRPRKQSLRAGTSLHTPTQYAISSAAVCCLRRRIELHGAMMSSLASSIDRQEVLQPIRDNHKHLVRPYKACIVPIRCVPLR